MATSRTWQNMYDNDTVTTLTDIEISHLYSTPSTFAAFFVLNVARLEWFLSSNKKRNPVQNHYIRCLLGIEEY